MGSSDPQLLANPSKRPFSTISKHPRRTNPASSKSLLSRKKVKIDQGPTDLRERDPSKDSPESTNGPPLAQQESSSDQSATKWFDGVNENVVGTRKNRSTIEEGRDISASVSINTQRLTIYRRVALLSCRAVNLQPTG